MKKNIFFVIIILFFNRVVVAQKHTDVEKLWTLQECIEYALTHNTQINRTLNNAQQSKAVYDQSIAAFLPSLNGSANQYFNFGRSLNTVTNQFEEVSSQTNNFSLNSAFILFDGLQNQLRAQQSRLAFKASIQDIEQSKNEITLALITAYLQFILNKELLHNTELQLLSTEEQLTRTEKLVEAGTLARVSYLEIKAQKASEELNKVNTQNQLDLAKLRIIQLMQLPYDSVFDVAIPQIEELQLVQLVSHPTEIYNIAAASQPSIKSAEWRWQSAKFGERSSLGSFAPRISLFGRLGTNYFTPIQTGLFTDNFFRTQIDNNLSKQIGLDVQIQLFNGWQTRTNWQQAVVYRKNAELAVVEAKTTLRQTIEQAYVDAKAAGKKYHASKERLEALKEVFRVAEQKFELGALTALDFTIAKNNLAKAESDFTNSKYEYLFRTKILDFYQNKPIAF